MSVDPQRIVALFADARQRFGDAVLRDPRRLVPMLSDQAPEMRGAIKATAAALAAGVADRLRGSGDPGGDMQRIAQEIAASDGLNPNDAIAGVHIAAQIGGLGAPAVPAPPPAPAAPVMPALPAAPIPRATTTGQTEWVGASSVVGAPATPAPAPVQAPPPAYQAQQPYPAYPPPPAPAQANSNNQTTKWVVGIAAVVGAVLLYQYSGGGGAKDEPQLPPQERPAPPPQGMPPQGMPPQGQPQRPPQGGMPPQGGRPPQGQPGGTPPMIAAPDSGQIPTLTPRDGGQAWVFEFLAPAGQQPVRVIVGVSKQGWGAGIVAVSSLGANEPETISSPGPFQLNRQGNDVYRVLQPQWQRDGLNVGGVCVVFASSNVQDVQLQGSKLCVVADNCQRMVGCGAVP